jgi:uncharacterized protein (DUF342 family)
MEEFKMQSAKIKTTVQSANVETRNPVVLSKNLAGVTDTAIVREQHLGLPPESQR